MKSNVKIDFHNMTTTLYEIAVETVEFISLLQTAVIYNTSKPFLGSKATTEEYMNESSHLSTLLKEDNSGDQNVVPYASVPGHLRRIWENLDRLSELIDKKTGENVLFSDRAVDESVYLLQRLAEILRPTADMILARNRFLGRYIQESQVHIARTADEYSTLHENRLVTGECMSQASSIYISMLESIKNIAWHTKEIAVSLGISRLP